MKKLSKLYVNDAMRFNRFIYSINNSINSDSILKFKFQNKSNILILLKLQRTKVG